MSDRILLASTWDNIARAERHADGQWTVDYILEDHAVRCMAVDPCSPATVYAGTDGQGVLRSDDRGATWRQAGLEGQVVKSLAVSPQQQGTLYAGVRPAGFCTSRDGGESWQEFRRFPTHSELLVVVFPGEQAFHRLRASHRHLPYGPERHPGGDRVWRGGAQRGRRSDLVSAPQWGAARLPFAAFSRPGRRLGLRSWRHWRRSLFQP